VIAGYINFRSVLAGLWL